MKTSTRRLGPTLAAALTAVAAVTGALLLSGPASAATLDLSSGSTSFGGTPAPGGFLTTYDFVLGVASTLSGSITAAVNGTQDVDFSYIGIVGPAGVYSFVSLLSDPFETWGLNAVTVPAGSYTLTLIGSNTPSAGSFAGNLGATAVPEPETYALLAGGLLAVLMMARRRR